jgi:hypothetical protein
VTTPLPPVLRVAEVDLETRTIALEPDYPVDTTYGGPDDEVHALRKEWATRGNWDIRLPEQVVLEELDGRVAAGLFRQVDDGGFSTCRGCLDAWACFNALTCAKGPEHGPGW